MFVSDSIVSFLMLMVDLFNHMLVLFEVLSELVLTLTQKNVHFTLNLRSKAVIDLNLLLTRKDSLLTGQLHLDLHFLNVFDLFNVVLLLHLPLPSNELGGVFKTHLHLGELISVLTLFLVDQVLLTLEHRNVDLYVGLFGLEIGHGSWLEVTELQIFDKVGLDLFFNLIDISS